MILQYCLPNTIVSHIVKVDGYHYAIYGVSLLMYNTSFNSFKFKNIIRLSHQRLLNLYYVYAWVKVNRPALSNNWNVGCRVMLPARFTDEVI